MKVKLSSMPDPKSLSSVTYSSLKGGLNLLDDPVRVGSTQSPDMLNMWYRDGVLKKRSGQRRVVEASEEGRVSGQVWFYDRLFNGLIVYLDGTAIKYYDPTADPVEVKTVEGTKIAEGTKHGCFFAFDERLYYKAEGVYLRLSYSDGELTAENILWKAGDSYESGDVYTPIIAINRNADGTGGDAYQPENRINPSKTVWFDIDDSSTDYYLPVAGCSIEKVQIGDEVEDTSGGAWPYMVGGREVTVCNANLAEDSAENTFLRFAGPLYVDETGWVDTPWLERPSQGWHFLSNIVYSDFDMTVNDETEMEPTEILHKGVGVSQSVGLEMPEEHVAHIINLAQSMTPFAARESTFFVLDNGQYMSMFFFPDDGGFEVGPSDPKSHVVLYDSDTTMCIFQNYFFVRYEYATQSFMTTDYLDTAGPSWHYWRNLAFSLVSFYLFDDEENGWVEAGVNTDNPNQLWNTDLVGIAYDHCGTLATELLFVEDGGSEWRYVFSSTTTPTWEFDKSLTNRDTGVIDELRVKKCYTATKGKQFDLESVVVVKIPKNNPLLGTVTPTAATNYTGVADNIIWSSCDIIWTYYNPGDVLLGASGDAMATEYAEIVDTALFRARRDYPDAAITGKVAIARMAGDSVWKNINVFVDAGISLTYYNKDTTEFKATGFIVETFTPTEETEQVTLDTTTPAVLSNKLRVTYRKENSDAFRAIADCEYATSFGGSDAVCVVLGGCNAQPNAIFWSGNGSYGIDPTYFPMDQYNLCGTYQDPVTGFGKQQSSLIVFQTSHTSKASYGIETIGERKYIDLTLSTINSERGCDMPWSIALCGNNLAWMHSKHGVMYLKSTTSAYENMIVVISENVNGSKARPGLLSSLKGTDKYRCVGMEDGARYYAFIGSELYVWDFSLSSVGDGISLLSWSKHQSFAAQSAVEADTGIMWIADGDGSIAVLDEEIDTDFGEPIACRYATPLETFNGYYRLRNVEKITLGVRSKTGGTLIISYGGEGQSGRQQKIEIPASEMYTPVVLKPRGLRLHHFQMTFEGDGGDGGLELMDIVMFYTAAGSTK